MTFVSRLLDLVRGTARPTADAGSDERLASAALLVHVAKVDGQFAAIERERLTAMVRAQFGFDPQETERFIARAQSVDDEAGDVAILIEMLGRDASEADRRRLLAAADAMARSDGRVLEFEDALVARLGRLLGFDEAEIARIRGEASA